MWSLVGYVDGQHFENGFNLLQNIRSGQIFWGEESKITWLENVKTLVFHVEICDFVSIFVRRHVTVVTVCDR